MNAIGFDVSHWSGFVNWDKAKQVGMEFAYFKATEGIGFVDDQLIRNIAEAQRVAIPFGVFHWFMPSVEPITQADWFCRQVPACIGGLPHIVDVEDKKNIPVDYAGRLMKFIDRVTELTGHVPMIYTSQNYWKTYIGDVHWFRQCRLIVANYRNDSPLVPLPWFPTCYAIWQFTHSAKGSAYGSQAKTVDLDVTNGPLANLLVSDI